MEKRPRYLYLQRVQNCYSQQPFANALRLLPQASQGNTPQLFPATFTPSLAPLLRPVIRINIVPRLITDIPSIHRGPTLDQLKSQGLKYESERDELKEVSVDVEKAGDRARPPELQPGFVDPRVIRFLIQYLCTGRFLDYGTRWRNSSAGAATQTPELNAMADGSQHQDPKTLIAISLEITIHGESKTQEATYASSSERDKSRHEHSKNSATRLPRPEFYEQTYAQSLQQGNS